MLLTLVVRTGLGGVTDTLHAWGAAMQQLYGTKRVDDLALTKLSFFTDNGYLYNAGGEVNGWATQHVLTDTFLALADAGLAVRLLQLDDWWYNANDTLAHMCVADGVGNSTLFPNGLTGLYDALQVRRKRLLGPLLYQKDRC